MSESLVVLQNSELVDKWKVKYGFDVKNVCCVNLDKTSSECMETDICHIQESQGKILFTKIQLVKYSYILKNFSILVDEKFLTKSFFS